MSLPFPAEYLALALSDELSLGDVRLARRKVADITLPSGRLVACDPFVCLDAKPLRLNLPVGVFPVLLSIAHVGHDQRVAFASVQLSKEAPTSWIMLAAGDDDPATLKVNEIIGYGVDSGTGCFADIQAATALVERLNKENDFFETMIAEMQKTYQDTWSWLDMKFGRTNLVAFSSGYGDGVYATYAGLDADRRTAVVVTDFGVVDPPHDAK